MANILVVEDQEQIRVLGESILQAAGHEVFGAAGVESAKALIDSGQHFDVLFADIELGSDSEGGLALAVYIRDRSPGVGVIYTTGKGVTDGLRAAFVDDFEFLSKPYTPDQLLVAVSRALPDRQG